MQKKVLLLHTGGTIGMGDVALRPKTKEKLKNTHYLAPDSSFAKSLRKSVPELWRLANIDVRTLANKDSSELVPTDWAALAKIIIESQDDYAAFVVTHGTDTMVYTGTALSYLLPYPCRPVILTGSQKALQEIRNDARRNLINSVSLGEQQRICEVSIFFDTKLMRANRAKKIHIEEFNTFASPNFPILAEERLNTIFEPSPRESLNRPQLDPLFDARIQTVRAFPGAQLELQPGAKAVVIEAFGCGNIPSTTSKYSVIALFKACARKKVPVILTSQVPAGRVAPEIYESGRIALELGAIPTRDMTFEATLIKCMMLAGNKVQYKDWHAEILSNWAGEISA